MCKEYTAGAPKEQEHSHATVLWPSLPPNQGHDPEPKELSPTQEVNGNMH